MRRIVPQCPSRRRFLTVSTQDSAVTAPQFVAVIVDLLVGAHLENRGPCALDSVRDQRFPQVEHVGTAHLAKLGPSPELDQAVVTGDRWGCGARQALADQGEAGDRQLAGIGADRGGQLEGDQLARCAVAEVQPTVCSPLCCAR